MKALICYNPKSGTQKVGKHLDYIKKRLSEKYDNIDVYTTTGPKSLVTHLEENAKNYDMILISGGDGTFNETITGIMKQESRPAIAYIPGGTCNDLAHTLKLKKNIKKAMNIILNGSIVKMDIGACNDKYFGYVFGVGKFIDISYTTPHLMKKRLGKVAYLIYGAKELVTRKKFHLNLKFNGIEKEGDYYVALCLNSDHLSGFKLLHRKLEILNDGQFKLTLIPAKGLTSFPRLLVFAFRGEKAFKRYGIESYLVSDVEILANEDMSFNTDGEHAFTSNSCHLRVLKEAVNIIVPQKTKEKYFPKVD